MASYTLAQLRTLAKQESDNVNASFISDAEWNRYIQGSFNELYGLIVEAYGWRPNATSNSIAARRSRPDAVG